MFGGLALLIATGGLGAAPEEITGMARQIQRQIVTLSNYGVFDDISFGFQGSSVILRGQASRPTLRKSAERVVSRIEGVEQVINEIEVLPVSGNDDRIRAQVYARIYGHPTLSRYDRNRGTPRWVSPSRVASGITNDPPRGSHAIHIIVKNGDVRLEGVVNTAGDKVMAGMQANSTPGVFAVSNDLIAAKETLKEKKK
jgi:osmotically-inducible protein OsmY